VQIKEFHFRKQYDSLYDSDTTPALVDGMVNVMLPFIKQSTTSAEFLDDNNVTPH